MRFGEIPVDQAAGAILAHSARHAGGVFKKGRTLSAADVALLQGSGVATVFAATLGPDDVPEDEAAAAVARAIAGGGVTAQEPFTGRANLHALAAGVAVIDAERVRVLNRLHESLTLATVAPFTALEAREMAATVKVIPFATPRAVLDQALAIARDGPMVACAPYQGKRAALIVTTLPQSKPSLTAKTEAAVRERVAACGGSLGETRMAAHRIVEVARAIRAAAAAGDDPILVFGASAIVDRGDVIPAAVAAAGGEVAHLGMPVDPGNLSMLGRVGTAVVIGVPSCARSPKLNGFDWILQRVMAGIPVGAQDIMDMGAGGLLKEIPSRPAPREGAKAQKAPRIAGVLLAAGLSSRMGGANKLLADIGGKPMVRHSARALIASGVAPVMVVTGHQAAEVRAALLGLAVSFAENPDYASGLASSLKTGIAALPAEAEGAVVALADMPLVEPRHIAKLVAAFNPAEGRSISVPVADGRRGNPVLWGRQHFPALLRLEGDRGARGLMEELTDEVAEVEMASSAVHADFDTRAAVDQLGASGSINSKPIP